MGTPMQDFQVVWDTGSSTFLIRSSDCTNCGWSSKFQIEDSSTFRYVSPTTYDTVRYMSGNELSGKLAHDNVCPVTDADSCANDFRFVAIETVYGLDTQVDGLVGLWSGNKAAYDKTEMFMYTMIETSTITNNIFSFFLTGLDGDSYIDFGTPNPAAMSDPSAILYIPIEDENYWWTSKISGIRWQGSTEEYALEEIDGVTDTGTSCIIGPWAEVKQIEYHILSHLEGPVYDDDYWTYTFRCSDLKNLPSFEMLYGGYWFEVLPEDYVIDIGLNSCTLCFTAYYSLDEWILGDAFMRGWYNIHDHDNL